MSAPDCEPGSGTTTANPSDDGNDLAPISRSTSESLLPDAIVEEVIDSSLLPPISSALMDEASAVDIAFIPMEQLLDDPTASGTDAADALGCPSTSVALEPSIVSGITELFEGDLCDDELPSILMPNGSNAYENLQLNPLELVEEVQAEMQQEAAADADVPPSMAAIGGEVVEQPMDSAASETDDKQPPPDTTAQVRRSVVPFAVVRKLSNAEGEKCMPPAPEVSSQKRPADTPSAAAVSAEPATKKACTRSAAAAAAIKKEQAPDPSSAPAGRVTRSRAKLGGPIADECLSSSPKKTKKVKSPPKASPRIKIVAPTAASTKAIAPAAPAPKPAVALVIAEEPHEDTKPLAPTPPPTEPVITDTSSATGSVTETSNDTALPVVTPVGNDEVATAKTLEMTNKIQSSTSSLPNLPSLSKSSEPTMVAKEPASTKDMVAIKAAASAAATKEPAKRPPRRASAPKAKAAAKTPLQPTVAVDTSTAHIQALTGENGASVCLSVRTCTFLRDQAANNAKDSEVSPPTTASSPPTTTSSSTTAAASTATTTTPAPMTEEERAQQSRDRNRKHARNTRLRKKAYVEELKQTLNQLVAQRDSAAAEQQQNRQREIEQREVRFRVMEEFLKLRGRNESDSNRWSAIMAPDFSLSMPITSFQTMVSTSTNTFRGQTLKGAEEVMQDSCHFAAFLQTLGDSATNPVPVSIVYQCDRNDFMMDGCNAVLGFNARSVGAVSKGLATELTFRGTVRAHFCAESNRLRSTSMMFDTGTIVDQRDAILSPTLA